MSKRMTVKQAQELQKKFSARPEVENVEIRYEPESEDEIIEVELKKKEKQP